MNRHSRIIPLYKRRGNK